MINQLKVYLSKKTIDYDILIGQELLTDGNLLQYGRLKGLRLAIISDSHVEPLYGKSLQKNLINQGWETLLLSFPAGEKQKSRQTKEQLENQLLAQGMGRDLCLIALGGGVVTDLTGFLASTYCRGVPFISVPTSLLAMVDASLGGKTGINVPYGKNMIGTIYQPSAIFIDIATLKTLPQIELKNGIVEMIKHGLILDAAYFNLLKRHARQILELDLPFLEKVIEKSCRIKLQVVEEDEYEIGKRRLLNFGHTIGHAIETLTEHHIAHGQAVAIGMIGESYLSMQLGYLSRSSFEAITHIFESYQISIQLDISLTPKDFFKMMKLDKKSTQNVPRFVLLKEIGKCMEFDSQFCSSVDENILQMTLEWICHAMRGH